MAETGIKWSRLIRRAGVAAGWDGDADPLVTCVVEDSREARGGCCFVAMRGLASDGHGYVASAVKAGAVAVVCERPVAVPAGVARLQVADAHGVVGRLASVVYGLDERLADGRLKVAGITGTNGKSTFCYLLREILRQAGCPTAMLGTIQYDLLSRRVNAAMTTPPASTFMRYLAEAVDAGATHAVVEVSSHALDQGRCDGVRFAVGVYSNLTGDHLDYHRDMASYLKAKKRLFDGLDREAVAVVNQDDPSCGEMVKDCRARLIRYGIVEREVAARPGVFATVHESTANVTRFDLAVSAEVLGGGGGECQSCRVVSPLIGRHNVQNSLAAAGAAIALGIELPTVVAGLEAMTSVPGRLERVAPAGKYGQAMADPGFTVLVDYAHTDDALRNVLSALRPLTVKAGGRLIVMFGCGGDRDRSKRPRMAAEAGRLADRIVVTSDNPRTEDAGGIIDDILAGFEPGQRAKVVVEPDRGRAIAEAISTAGRGDVVLLAGKGHEDYQIVGTQRLSFDDAKVAADVLSERVGVGA